MIKQIICINILAFSISSAYCQSIPLPTTLPKGLPITANMPQIINLPPLEITKASASQTDTLQFNDIPFNNLLTIIFNEVLNKNFVMSPAVIQENRTVSFKYSKKDNGSLESFMTTFITTMGYEISIKNGVYYIQEKHQKKPDEYDYFVYKPKNRESNYILNMIRPYFGENFTGQTSGIKSNLQSTNSVPVTSGSALAQIDQSQEVITFRYESKKEKDKILSLINQIDSQVENVLVKAYIYEVNYSKDDGSAMGLVLNLANSKLKINIGSPEPLQNFVNFSSNAMSLLFSNINTDTRFRLLSNPFLRVKNNKLSSFNVGQTVPVLGSISYPGAGNAPVQEVKYVDTGLSFQITPKIQSQSIDIELMSEISEAQNTTTGLNNTPTLTKRKLTSNFTTKKNEVVMLAGLTNNKTNENTSLPFFMPFFKNKNNSRTNTEILIFLEASTIEPTEGEK